MMRYAPKDHLELPQRHRPVMRWQGLAFGLLVMVPFWVLVAALLWTFLRSSSRFMTPAGIAGTGKHSDGHGARLIGADLPNGA